MPTRLGTAFRWLLASSWATNLGDGIAIAAGPLLVASLTRDAFLISLAALLRWAPPLVFGLYAGVLSDRLDRRRIVLCANAFRGIVLVLLVVGLATGRLNVGLALLALGLISTAEVFADNTTGTLTPMLVHRDDLAIANSRIMGGFITLNQLAGPPIGALLFAAGWVWPFAAEAVLVAAGILLIAQLRLPPHGPSADERARSIRRDVLAGIRWTIRHPAVRTLVLTVLIFDVTFGAAWSVLVLYAQERLGLGAVGFGLLTTVSAVGGLLGTALYGWITRHLSLSSIMRIGLILETLTHLVLALTTSGWIAAVTMFVIGAHNFIWSTTSVTIRQRAVPTELQGRVNSVNTICVFGGLVVGSAIGGALASHAGAAAPFWFAFVGTAIFLVALWRQLTNIAHTEQQVEPAEVRAPVSAAS